ncbi:MAG: membrane protein insertion efficiency factor YidD [Candidatus Omnitrophota bacterium]
MTRKICLSVIDIYQMYIRGFFPACCRFTPTCSEYARLAFLRYGLLTGGLKTLFRILKCQPFNPASGYDPLK